MYGFTDCKLFLTNLITFFIVMTGFEDEDREVDALHFGKILSLLLQHLWS